MNDDKALRAQRLAAALRANLARRKHQARQRLSGERRDAGEPKQSEGEEPGTNRSADKA